MNNWIPVSERLPESAIDVLVYGINHGSSSYTVAGIFSGIWASQETEEETRFEPTHWMPLPAAPIARGWGMSEVTFACECCGAFHTASELRESGGYCPQCDADYDERKMFAKLASDYDQLKAENERIVGQSKDDQLHMLKVIAERDTLRKQLDEARELLEMASCGIAGGDDMQRIDAWLEDTKK